MNHTNAPPGKLGRFKFTLNDDHFLAVKIVSWNCNGALRNKLAAVRPLDADVYIIQECEDPARSDHGDYQAWASNHLWSGDTKNKGIGVFAREGISLQRVHLDPGPLQLFLPCVVADRLSLLAVWTKQANSPTFRYIGQVWKYLQLHGDFLRATNSALIGDLNSNSVWDVWDRWWNHSDVVRELQELGLNSAYHYQRGEEQGRELSPTLYLQRNVKKPYHVDYAFLSETLIKGATLEVGTQDNWLQISDHMPLIIRLG